MGLVDAIRLAAEHGCELCASGDGRVIIRAIGYDADPVEIDEARLLTLDAQAFVDEWLPERFDPAG